MTGIGGGPRDTVSMGTRRVPLTRREPNVEAPKKGI
jgi:hypothetical protein